MSDSTAAASLRAMADFLCKYHGKKAIISSILIFSVLPNRLGRMIKVTSSSASTGYSVIEQEMNSRDEILSAMVVYGFLLYHDGFLSIPNHELMEKIR